MQAVPLIQPTPNGLYCQAGDFYIDPWRPVPRAVVTHAHSDHARPGCDSYLCAQSGAALLRQRVHKGAAIEGVKFGEHRKINNIIVSLYPSGHILGSAQVRVEHQGEVWVVSGDYKTAPDPSCESFEVVTCQTFITECTFGLPVYRWPRPEDMFVDIHRWWEGNQEQGRTSVLFAYALGKAQRLLAGLDASIGPIGVHGAVAPFLPLYAAEGIKLAAAEKVTADNTKTFKSKGLIIAPSSAQNTPWLRKFAPYSLAFASGWMAVRGARRRGAYDRGFVLSDHCDWPGLVETVLATGAENIGVTHGHTAPFIRYLQEEHGLNAFDVPTRFVGETATGEETDGHAEPPAEEPEA